LGRKVGNYTIDRVTTQLTAIDFHSIFSYRPMDVNQLFGNQQ